jgi:hypothetical protein
MGGSVDGGDLERELDAWRAEEAAAARTRERWLRQQATEQARMALVLADACAGALRVRLHTAAGGTHAGVVLTAGVDVAVVAGDRGEVVVALAAVTAVEVAARTALGGGREPDADVDGRGAYLLDELAARCGDEPKVEVRVTGGERLVGVLRSVGVDVVALGRQGNECYVPLWSVSEVAFLGSG